MAKTTPWEVERSETMADYRVFEVTALHSRAGGSGPSHTFYRIESPDWANVIPVTERDEIVMIRQFRHGLGREVLEIPGGLIDPGESPQAAAARELLEETGYQPAGIELLGSLSPNPALFANRQFSFLATGCTQVAKPSWDEHEEVAIELVPKADLPAMLAAGQVDHALVMLAFHWLALRDAAPAMRSPR